MLPSVNEHTFSNVLRRNGSKASDMEFYSLDNGKRYKFHPLKETISTDIESAPIASISKFIVVSFPFSFQSKRSIVKSTQKHQTNQRKRATFHNDPFLEKEVITQESFSQFL